MKILHVIGGLDPACGGPPKICISLAAAQAALGHTVNIVSPERPASLPAIVDLFASIPHSDGVRHVVLPLRGAIDRHLCLTGGKLLRPLIAEADIVHLHSAWDSILRVAGRQCRAMHKPYLVLLNGMLDPWSLAQGRWKKKLAMALAYRRLFNGAAALHLGNEDERRLIAPLKLRPPGVIIPNGVFLEEIDPLPPAGTFRAAYPMLGDGPFVLFMSRLHYKKGPDYLVNAFAQVAERRADVKLVIAGPDEGARGALERQITALDLTDRVLLPGPLAGERKYGALVDAACFCLPSWQEGFSMAITEALACGLPAVVSEGCHFPEVADAGAGMVVPLEVDALAAALLEVLSDDDARRRMGDVGRDLVRSRFTWPRIAEQTIAVYQGILDRAPS